MQTTKRTWCGICEAACGVIATVDDGRLLTVLPDPDHPASQGFACAKGMAWPDVLRDPDRLVEPMRRRADGTFETVDWDTALNEIGQRLRRVIAEHGRESVGLVQGNPTAGNYSAFMALLGMSKALGTRHYYSAASVDIFNYWVVNRILYGHSLTTPVPDFAHTDVALIVGSNPLVSHGSMATMGRVQDHLRELPRRGGRMFVVDPRRTETAKLGEHIPIRPGGDPWFLAALLHIVLRDGAVDRAGLAATIRGIEFVDEMVAELDLDRCAAEAGVPLEQIEEIAHALAQAPRAVVYGRCGISLGRFSSLCKYLLDCLAAVTGNLDRAGGLLFPDPYFDAEMLTKILKLDGYDRWRTRVDQLPEVFGQSPLAAVVREIRTPGRGSLRAVIAVSTNFAMTSPASKDVAAALDELDLLVSIDPYITETSARADFILPPALLMERDGLPLFAQLHAITPNAQWSEAIVEPPSGVREDGWIIEQICRQIKLVPSAAPGAQLLGRLGIRPSTAWVCDVAIRIGPHGDWFGLRPSGLSRHKLLTAGRSIAYAEHPPEGAQHRRVHHRDRRVHLDHPLFAQEMKRLLVEDSATSSAYPLRLFTIRELRSQNSWLHNIPKLMSAGRRHTVRINPIDAFPRGIASGSDVEIVSAWGRTTTVAEVTDEVVAGAVGMPAQWGHSGGTWKRANRAGGGVYNDLVPDDPANIDKASGNAWFNGVEVSVELTGADAPSADSQSVVAQ